MKTCPHCGAKLVETARYCHHCMTTLNEKRVIPTPKYFPVRWQSAAAAVLVLCVAVWGVWQMRKTPSSPTATTVVTPTPTVTTTTLAIAPTSTATATTAATTVPSTLVTQSTTAASVTKSDTQGTSSTISSATYTQPTSEIIPPVSTSIATQTATTGRTDPTSVTGTPTAGTSSTTSTQKPTTSTQRPTMPTTAPKPAYPPEWDTVYRSTTEDNLPIEEVTWTYKAAGEKMYLSRGLTSVSPRDSFPRTYTHTLLTSIPMSQCIILTGFDAPASNGIYRIPAAIDGKVVVGVSMGDNEAGACHFNDPDIAPTVKRIYLPPEMLMIGRNTINQCTALEGIYFGTDTIWIEPEALPATYLYMYSYNLCYVSCSEMPHHNLPQLKNYCQYIDQGDGYTLSGSYGHYWRTTWRSSTFARDELYHSDGALSPYD